MKQDRSAPPIRSRTGQPTTAPYSGNSIPNSNPTNTATTSRRLHRRMGTAGPSSSRSEKNKDVKNVLAASAGFLGVVMILVLASTLSLPTGKLFTSATYFSVEDVPTSIILKLDAVLVLGGGVPASLEVPLRDVQRRCDDAAKVVQKRRDLTGWKASTSDLPILCLSAGSKHGAQLLSADGLPVWESTSCAAYLEVNFGIKNVFVETTSYDTIGNAFFARTTHTDIVGWRRLLVITNEFHMDRTRAIFDWIFGVGNGGYEITYLATPNVGLKREVLKARKQKEQQSLQSIEKLKDSYRTLRDVWQFLNSEHDMYTASKLVERARGIHLTEDVSELVRKSYGGGH